MQASHLHELCELEDSYWWHVAKRQLVTRLLKKHCPPPGRLIEGGIGSGRNLAEFREMGYAVSGFDVMPESVSHVKSRGIEDVQLHDLGQPWPVADGELTAVVLLDVLEHVEDPVTVLKHVHRALRPDGAVVITVPAYPWLFGRWDEQLGHFRRYTRRMFRTHAAQADFDVAWLNHWNSFTLPAAIAVRSWEKVFPAQDQADFPKVSPFTNRALLAAAASERWCMEKLPVPAGLSLAGVLKKPAVER